MNSSLSRCVMRGWARMQVVDKVRVPRFNPDSNQPVHGLHERFNMGWLHGLPGLKPDHVQSEVSCSQAQCTLAELHVRIGF